MLKYFVFQFKYFRYFNEIKKYINYILDLNENYRPLNDVDISFI